MNQSFKGLESWFTQRPKWLQDAARRLIKKGPLNSADLADLTTLCKQEAGINDTAIPRIQAQGIPPGSLQVSDQSFTLRLEEISNVQGINALSPRNPLKLGDGPLTIIYGGTGSGKSGYVRILKNACGAKGTKELHGNVFDFQQVPKSCVFKIKVDDADSKNLPWSPDKGLLADLKAIEIYDTDCAHVYLTQENEVAYEPWVLSLLTQLTSVCTHIGKTIKDEIDHSSSVIPVLPIQYWETKSALWYSNLNHETKQHEIEARCLWNKNLETALIEFNRRLSQPDPAEQAKQLRNTKANVLILRDELKKIYDRLSDKNCSEYLGVRGNAAAKRTAADEDAKKVFENAPLDGVGSESWRLLWDQARAYSEEIAYPGIPFPHLSEEARCVLCHQLLEHEAKDRFRSFEEFVKGQLQKQASEAEKQVRALEKEFEGVLSTENLGLYMNSARIIEDTEREEISAFHQLLLKRRDSLLKAKTLTDVTTLPDDALLEKLEDHSGNLEKRANKYDKDARKEKRDILKRQALELEAKQHLSELKPKIDEEVTRLKHIHGLEKARKLTNPKSLSDKKSGLADMLISPVFVKRFNDELTVLGASRIRVELIKTRTEYGHVYHVLRLRNCVNPVSTTEILSEGEFRIVSLAAFLADVEGRPHITPFIFDDPISSLDQDFEEKTVDRLIELCRSRQVIVFTHRLSLLSLLENAAKKAGIPPCIKCLRHEPWGAGEPGDTPINAQNIKGALNKILKERLPRARKARDEKGSVEYELLAKGICSDIRILVERIVEKNLLADVIERFRREVQTKNKIQNLAKINIDDCKLIDGYMTKYSKYEHSQPSEAPVQIPPPDEIEEDLNQLVTWLLEFQKR